MADLDVFLIGGQSNAVGNGNGVQSPKVTPGKLLQFYGGAISDANDPVGNAAPGAEATVGGSAWPEFLQSYYATTRRAAMVVPCAIGGSAQCAAADGGAGNWDSTGSLLPAALAALASSLTAATAAGWTPHFVGVLWSQGETDAFAVRSGAITVSTYKNALYLMVATIQTAHPGSFFYIFRTGGDDSPGFSDIRQAQEDMASFYHDSRPLFFPSNMRIIFRGAAYFSPANGLMQINSLHYTQQGYNIMGKCGANAVCQNGISDASFLIEGIFPNATRTMVQTD